MWSRMIFPDTFVIRQAINDLVYTSIRITCTAYTLYAGWFDRVSFEMLTSDMSSWTSAACWIYGKQLRNERQRSCISCHIIGRVYPSRVVSWLRPWRVQTGGIYPSSMTSACQLGRPLSGVCRSREHGRLKTKWTDMDYLRRLSYSFNFKK
jgi:hypothetical protein